MIETPPTVLPKMLNVTFVKSGRMMSASPAKASGTVSTNMTAKISSDKNILRLLIYNLLKIFVNNC